MSNSDDSTPIIPEGWTTSTYLNSSIKSYSDVAHRVKVRLGYPTNDVDVTDEAIANNINEAIEQYTRYAGYDTEYVIFCDDALQNGCEIKLDDLVDSCYSIGGGCTLSSDSALVYDTFVSAINVTNTLIGSSDSIVHYETSVSSNDSQILNVVSESIDVSKLELKYDPTNAWDFSVCDANRVVLTPLSSYPPQDIKSPCMDAWIKVSDGNAEVYPQNWESLDPCLPLSAWWGIDNSELSSFDPSSATNIIIKNVPNCTVGGLQSLDINTGRGSTFRVEDKALDTCGYINAQVQYVNDYNLPTGLSGSFGVETNTGFKLTLESQPDQFMNAPEGVVIGAEFYQSLSAFEYGVSAYAEMGFIDDSTKCPRKVADAFFDPAGPAGQHHGDLLFNFEYAFMQDFFGYDGMGSRISTRGYDLITYDLSRQFLETVDKYFGGNTIGFQFNKRTQKLRLFQNNNSRCNNNSCYLVGVHLERSIEHILPEPWIVDYVTALTKITMGNTLTKFGGATTLGGLTINGNDVLNQGLEEKKELLIWLREDNSEGGLDTPVYIY